MIKIMIVDDHDLVRTAIKSVLRDIPGTMVIGEAASGEEATTLARQINPDLTLMDFDMPGIGGLEAVRKLLRHHPKMKIIVLSAYTDSIFSSRMLQAGVSGYVSKNANKDELAQAIKLVTKGQRYLNPIVASELAMSQLAGAEKKPLHDLTDRELQILLMIVQGINVKQVAKVLHLSPKTVSTYRNSLFKKLGIRNNVELISLAVKFGLLDSNDLR